MKGTRRMKNIVMNRALGRLIERYEAYGDVYTHAAIQAVKKQIPKELVAFEEDSWLIGWKFPECGGVINEYASYCKFCGQAICND